jgi:hypothetical protein
LALPLAKSLQRHHTLTQIFSGLFSNVLSQGRVAESVPWVGEMLDTAEAAGNPDLLIIGHMSACDCHFCLGELEEAMEHADRVLDLYDNEKHRHLADLLNHDPKTRAGIYGSVCIWMMGYPDRARRLNNETDAHARRRGHPFDLGYALTMGMHVDRRFELEELRNRAEECERLGRENSLPVMWTMLAPMSYGQALILGGRPTEGIARLQAAIAVWGASHGKLLMPILNARLAEGMVLIGDFDSALSLIEAQITQIERPGWEERLHYAEIMRLKGWIGIAPPSWTVDRLGGLRGHGKFLGGLLLIVDGRLVSNR